MRLGTAASLFSVGRVVADFVCDVIRVVITVVSCRRHCCSQCRVGAAVDVVNILNIFSTFFLLLLMGSQHFVSALPPPPSLLLAGGRIGVGLHWPWIQRRRPIRTFLHGWRLGNLEPKRTGKRDMRKGGSSAIVQRVCKRWDQQGRRSCAAAHAVSR